MVAFRAGAVLLAVLATQYHVAAAVEASADRERQLLDRVEAIVARDGPYAASLLEPLTGLTVLYQDGDEHGPALVAIERSLQVVRVNSGLHTLEQVPLLMQKLRSEEARHDDAAVWELEQATLALLRRHPDDLRTAPMLRAIADRQMDTLHEYLYGERPPEVVYGCFYKEWPTADEGGCTAGSRQTVVRGMLAEAQRNYAEAIAVMLRHGLYNDELHELEMELLDGINLFRLLYESPGQGSAALIPGVFGATHMEPWRSRVAPVAALATWDLPFFSVGSRGEVAIDHLGTSQLHLMQPYYRGRLSLLRLHAYAVAGSRPPVEQAGAVAEIADWDLLYSHNGLAVEGYEAAYAMLRNAGVSTESLDELFSPPTPVVLPAFEPNPLARDATRPETGHIDVAFTITKYGRGRDVEIREAVNATEAARAGLVTLIKQSRFRPRPTAGRFGVDSLVAVRYGVYD